MTTTQEFWKSDEAGFAGIEFLSASSYVIVPLEKYSHKAPSLSLNVCPRPICSVCYSEKHYSDWLRSWHRNFGDVSNCFSCPKHLTQIAQLKHCLWESSSIVVSRIYLLWRISVSFEVFIPHFLENSTTICVWRFLSLFGRKQLMVLSFLPFLYVTTSLKHVNIWKPRRWRISTEWWKHVSKVSSSILGAWKDVTFENRSHDRPVYCIR